MNNKKNKQMTPAEKKAFRAGASYMYNKAKLAGFSLGLDVAHANEDFKKDKKYNAFR